MLTLGRKPGEYIVIDETIIVTVNWEDGTVRVSIDAPKEVNIVRGEVYEQTHPRPICLDDTIRKGRKSVKRTEQEKKKKENALQG